MADEANTFTTVFRVLNVTGEEDNEVSDEVHLYALKLCVEIDEEINHLGRSMPLGWVSQNGDSVRITFTNNASQKFLIVISRDENQKIYHYFYGYNDVNIIKNQCSDVIALHLFEFMASPSHGRSTPPLPPPPPTPTGSPTSKPNPLQYQKPPQVER
jgi:hypothetical protein